MPILVIGLDWSQSFLHIGPNYCWQNYIFLILFSDGKFFHPFLQIYAFFYNSNWMSDKKYIFLNFALVNLFESLQQSTRATKRVWQPTPNYNFIITSIYTGRFAACMRYYIMTNTYFAYTGSLFNTKHICLIK